jgi:hypothetical protein
MKKASKSALPVSADAIARSADQGKERFAFHQGRWPHGSAD